MKRYFLLIQERHRVSIAALFLCALVSPLSFALQESTGPNGSNVQVVHALGYTGQGVSVGLISQNHARVTHEAFAGHAFCYNATDPGNTTCLPSNHDTSVGGIICSRGGAAYPDDTGAAPEAELYSVKIANGTSVSTAWIIDGLDYLAGLDPVHPIQKCQVVVTGIQFTSGSVPPDGTSIWTRIYDYYAYAHNMVFATAAGNYDTSVTVFGDSYNSITTGGLIGTTTDLYDKIGTGSNYGPTADGRNKPDIAAPSQNQWVPINGDSSWRNEGTTAGQTSWSVPHTGGVAAVLLSYANSPESSEDDDDQNEVIKAVIVNSAFPNIQDKGGNGTIDFSDPNWPWHEDRGYGRIDALRAYETLRSPITYNANTHQSVDVNINQSTGWFYRTFNNIYITDRYWISGTRNNRLVLTMTWNRKVNKSGSYYYAETDPMNLNIEIFDPQDVCVFSEHLDDMDPPIYNNLRKADILLESDGYYEVRITSTEKKNENRSYAMAFELLEPLTADFDINYIVDVNDMAEFLPYWLETDCTSEPCSDYDLSDSNSIDLSDFSIFAEKWLTYDPRYYSP